MRTRGGGGRKGSAEGSMAGHSEGSRGNEDSNFPCMCFFVLVYMFYIQVLKCPRTSLSHTFHTFRYSVGRITTEPAPREPSDQDFQLKVWEVWAKCGGLQAKCEQPV